MTEKLSREIIERREQMLQITTLVAGNFELQEVLDRLAEAAVIVTSTTACSIRLLDDDADDLKMRSTFGLSEEYRNKGVVSKEDPVIKAAFDMRRFLLRGIEGVGQEWLWASTAFNLKKLLGNWCNASFNSL